jgi:porphobilinogen synthase
MPGYYRYSLDLLMQEVQELCNLGCQAFLLFVKVEEHLKDNAGKEAVNPNGLMQRATKALKEAYPQICLMTDVAMDPYSSYGHDGVVYQGEINNDETLEVLTNMAVSHAKAGADFIAPSDMMDGRVQAIRQALDKHGYKEVGIMAYSAKYASCFYGPFRDALDSAPAASKAAPGNKKTYQMNPANAKEALTEAALDEKEGADILMVKPAMAYLDIIKSIKENTTLPVSAYHVSGEYAMIKAASANGWLNQEEAMLESLIALKRAGANLIATYFVKDVLKHLLKN